MVNEFILQLVEEMDDPCEKALEDEVEKSIDAEDSILFGDEEFDDEIIERINSGEKLGYEDPIVFADPEVKEVIDDETFNQ